MLVLSPHPFSLRGGWLPFRGQFPCMPMSHYEHLCPGLRASSDHGVWGLASSGMPENAGELTPPGQTLNQRGRGLADLVDKSPVFLTPCWHYWKLSSIHLVGQGLHFDPSDPRAGALATTWSNPAGFMENKEAKPSGGAGRTDLRDSYMTVSALPSMPISLNS